MANKLQTEKEAQERDEEEKRFYEAQRKRDQKMAQTKLLRHKTMNLDK